MKRNILVRTNTLVSLVIVAGFLLTAVLSYRANYSVSLENIEQVSTLTSEGIYYQLSTTFTKPVNISLTMANDSLLMEFLADEENRMDDPAFEEGIQNYLRAYREKYRYDSVFLVSEATKRYYNFNGFDRVLTRDDPENVWYYDLAAMTEDYRVVVDNDEVVGADNDITIFVNCKIKDGAGGLLGVVGVGLRIDYLQKLLQGYQEEFGVNAYLIDDTGTIQISSEYSGYRAVNLFEIDRYDQNTQDRILNWREDEAAERFWADRYAGGGGENYVVARYLPELEWHLVVERDTGALMAELSRQLTVTIAVILLIIAIILVVITRVIRSFNKQIVTLTRSVEQERRTLFEQATEEMFENIYELDITHNCPANKATEAYFESLGAPPGTPYDRALHIVAEQQIKEEFRQGYLDTFLPEHATRAYAEGRESLSYDFMISRDGQGYYWMRITARMVRLESDGSLHMLTYRQNIDAEKNRERRMLELAQTEEMTGLLNKTATQREIEGVLEQGAEPLYAFFIFDIDHFKQANDCFGHAFGDGVIRYFAGVLQAQFRHTDLLGRIGGDEFAAFLAVPDRGWAARKADELVQALDVDYREGEACWHMSASIGVSFAPDDGTNFETLYQRADAALYETKKRGRAGFTLYHGTEREEGG